MMNQNPTIDARQRVEADLLFGAVQGLTGQALVGSDSLLAGPAGGTPSGPEIVFNVNSLNGANGFVVTGHHSYDQIGAQVAGAGDLNGDGYADFLISDVNGNDQTTEEVYAVFGHAGSFAATLDTAALNGPRGFVIQVPDGIEGDTTNSLAAGDFNGDGRLDIVIGASRTPAGGQNFAGATYLLFGHDGGWGATESVTDLNGSDGFKMHGPKGGAAFGDSLVLADINGDGLDDLIVGAQGAAPHGAYSGAVYVVFGTTSPMPADFSLNNLDGVAGFDIRGMAASDLLGPVADAGDVNGDGYEDLIIGAPGVDGGKFRPSTGAAYVVYGHAGGFPAHLDVSKLDGTNGFRIDGDSAEQSDLAGRSVSGGGDVNGDGFSDLLVGANPYSHVRDGAAYVVFGAASSPGAAVGLAGLDGAGGFKVIGASSTYTASEVASAGDINGDGFTDVIVNATGQTARAFVVYGHAGPFAATIDLNTLTAAQGFEIVGNFQGTPWPHSVASAGDVNGDGLDDLLIGARGDPKGGSQYNGATYVIFGQKPQEAVNRVGTIASQHLAGGDFGDALSGLGGDDVLFGNGGADTLTGGAGNDTINGGADDDTVVFTGDIADYRIIALGDGNAELTDLRDSSPDGTDLVVAVESFAFADGAISADDLFRTLTIVGGAPDQQLVEAGVKGAGIATTETSALASPDASGAISYDLAGWSQTGATTFSHAGTYGVAVLDTATGVISYVLDNDNPLTQALAVGQTVTDAFTVILRDEAGGLGSTVVSFNVQGGDDAPVITDGGEVFTDLVESGLDGAGLNAVSSSPIRFSDPDATDTVTFNLAGWHRIGATTQYTHVGVYGTATLDVATHVVSYVLNNSDRDTQALGDGDTVTDSFLVAVSDGHGGTATTTVVFTIDGVYDSPVGTRQADVLVGDAHDDLIDGGKGDDSIDGGAGADTLLGSAGKDSLDGGDGIDRLEGGLGADQLTGGLGKDVFTFATVSDSWKKGIDLITDLTKADVIDLSAVDADSGNAGDQAFHLVSAFSHHAGELVVSYDASSGLTLVQGDVDGNGKADLIISIAGDLHGFTNFVL